MARISDDMEAFLAMLQGAHGAHGGGSPAAAGTAARAARVGPAPFGPDESSAFDSALAEDRKTQDRSALAQNLFNAGAIFQGQPAKAPVSAAVPSEMQKFVMKRQLAHEGAAAAEAKQPAPAEWGAPTGLTRPEALGQGWAKKSEHQMKPGDAAAPAEWGAPAGMASDQAVRAGYGHNPKELDAAHGPPTDADTSELRKRGINPGLASTHADAMHLLDIHARSEDARTRSEQTRGDKSDQKLDKRLAALRDDLDPNKARGGNMTKNQQRVDAADRLTALVTESNGALRNLDQRQMEELAIGLANLLSSGTAAAQAQINALVPQTVWGNAQKLREWLSNDPTGTNQQSFVKRMVETVDRERQVAAGKVRDSQIQRLGAHANVFKTNPEEARRILRDYGIDDTVVDGNFQPKPKGGGRGSAPADPLGIR